MIYGHCLPSDILTRPHKHATNQTATNLVHVAARTINLVVIMLIMYMCIPPSGGDWGFNPCHYVLGDNYPTLK